jgi:hypothetical protein
MRSEAGADPAASPLPQRAGWRRHGTTLVSIAASGALLVGLYRTLDVHLIVEALLKADRLWVVISVGLIVPITVLRAIRFFWVAPAGALPGIGEAFRLTLVASALNVFVPAKAGDLIKSYFVAKRSATTAGVAIAIIMYERVSDMFGLVVWSLLGWQIGRPQLPGLPLAFWAVLGALGGFLGVLISSERAADVLRAIATKVLPHRKLQKLAQGWPDLLRALRGRRLWIVSFSIVLWMAHLFQMWMFTVALSMRVPFTVCASVSAIALMAGQLPFTFAGLGTRDMALVVLLSNYTSPESAAAMGLLIATRNLLPPLIGLPMIGPYLSSVVGEARRWRRQAEHLA